MKTEGKILLGGCIAIALAIAIFGHDDGKSQTAAEPKKSAQPQATPAQLTQQQQADALAAVLTQQFKDDGSDVTVVAAGDLLLFDCSAELHPRESCWLLYKQPLDGTTAEVYRKVGIRKLEFKTKSGVWADPDWKRELN